MSTENKKTDNKKAFTIGFLGIDSYDIIHYLSRILCKMEKKVLLVDCSNTHGLTNSVPGPDELDKTTVIHYRNVDFTASYKKEQLEQYDVIFFDFTDNVTHHLIDLCEDLYLVTDQQRHNISKVKQIYDDTTTEQYVTVIIRNVVKCKIGMKYLLNLIGFDASDEHYYVLDADVIDQELMLLCQYDNVFSFKKISNGFKKMLISILVENMKLEEKEVKLALKKAEKGA